MQYGLSAETIAKIIAILQAHAQVVEAILYGSRAKGNYKPGSDIDLVLKGSGLDYRIVNRIVGEFYDSNLPYMFDVSSLDQINNVDLLDHINRVGVSFYKR